MSETANTEAKRSFFKLLSEQAHIGVSHGNSVQVHIEFNDMKQRNEWLAFELECPACGEMFNPVGDINSHAYGRRKSYVRYGCKGMECHKSTECLDTRKAIIKFVEQHGPKWRCVPNPEKPGLEFEQYFPNIKPHWPLQRFSGVPGQN